MAAYDFPSGKIEAFVVILGVYSVYSKMIRFFNEKNYDKGLKYETLTAEMQLQSSEIKLTTYLSQY